MQKPSDQQWEGFLKKTRARVIFHFMTQHCWFEDPAFMGWTRKSRLNIRKNLSAVQTSTKITLCFTVLSRKSVCAFSGVLILICINCPNHCWNPRYIMEFSFYINNFFLLWPVYIFPATNAQYFYNSLTTFSDGLWYPT